MRGEKREGKEKGGIWRERRGERERERDSGGQRDRETQREIGQGYNSGSIQKFLLKGESNNNRELQHQTFKKKAKWKRPKITTST